MRHLRSAVLLIVSFAVLSCGSSSSSSNNVNGNWTASLVDPSGTPVYSFTTSLTQGSNTTVIVTNVNFTTATEPCFDNTVVATDPTYGASGNFSSGSGNTIFQLNLASDDGNNLLKMDGTLANSNTITGNWTFTTGCSGSGSFTMTRM